MGYLEALEALETLDFFASSVSSTALLDSLDAFCFSLPLVLLSLDTLVSLAFSALPVSSVLSTEESTSDISPTCVSTAFCLPIASSFSFSTSTSGNTHGSCCFPSTRAFASPARAFTNSSVITRGGTRLAVNAVPTRSSCSASPS